MVFVYVIEKGQLIYILFVLIGLKLMPDIWVEMLLKWVLSAN